MSLYSSWTAYGVPPQPITTSESSSNREAVWSDTRIKEHLRYVHLPGMRPQSGFYDSQSAHSSRLQRLPPPSALHPSDRLPTQPNHYCHSLVQQNHANELSNLGPGSRNSLSPADTPNYTAYVPASSSYDHPMQAHRLPAQVFAHPLRQENSHGHNDQDDVFNSSPITSPIQPAWYPIATYSSDPPRRSKAALAAEDWDHPSFARPPHRPIDSKPQTLAVPRIVNLPSIADSCSLAIQHDIMKSTESEELLVPSSYPVPPPPPYELSAAPLSDLAAEMVWERCFNPRQHRSSSTSPIMATRANPVNDTGFSWGIPSDYHLHYSRGFEHSAIPLGSQWDPVLSDQHRGISPVNSFGAIGAEAKARRAQQQHFQQHHGIKPLRTEAKPAFRRWTRQVLEQTLLSPQVLVLALYYVDAVSGKDVFGDASRGKASLVPYKILLAALVLANKTLDDHSYKNSTFANVSSMTNSEVNAIEVAMLKALHFDTVPSLDEWRRWIGEVVKTGEGVAMGASRSRKKEESAIISQLKQQQTQALEYFASFGTHHQSQAHAISSHLSPRQNYSIGSGVGERGYQGQTYSLFNE